MISSYRQHKIANEMQKLEKDLREKEIQRMQEKRKIKERSLEL
jgi:hypothetical protein